MEEKLDKLISLIEMQNKAWDKCLQLLIGINEVLTAKSRDQQLLLEQHPPMQQPVDHGEAPPAFNAFSDTLPYGTDLEMERASAYQSFPPAPTDQPPQNQPPTTEQNQLGHREESPEVPVTSKAEMMEQAEKRETTPEV